MKFPLMVPLAGALALGPMGCTHMSRTQQGALGGAAGGALVGGGLSVLTGGNGTTGALIGGGLGGFRPEAFTVIGRNGTSYGGHGRRW